MGYFDAIKKVIKNVQALDEGKILKKVLDGNSQLQYDIIQLNLNQLYEQGTFADGVPTGGYSRYSFLYKTQIAGGLGFDTRSDHRTFKDTGTMYQSERMKVSNDGFILTMDTVKDGDDLENLYGKITGLTEESLGEARGWILPLANEEVLQQILK